MAGQYSYPPPPPPPPSAAPPANGYSSYGQGQTYSHTPSRGGAGNGAARGRGPNRAEYGAPYGGYPQSEYGAHNANSYNHQPPSGYWGGNAPPPNNAPLLQSNYHPNYAPQAYAPQPHAGYQPTTYPASGQRPAYTPTYSSAGPEYSPAQQWSETGSPYSSPYSNRGGRGGYQGDRGGHRSDHNASMMYTAQASSGYGQQYPPPTPQHHSTPTYPQPPQYHNYPPVPAPTYTGPAHNSQPHHRGRGRDGFSGGNFRGRPGHNDRGDKFRHKGQRPHHDHNPAQKSEVSSAKKKKRKTNTLGLTPGDGDESDDASVDEEQHLVELLGADAPVVPDIVAWIAERKANYPTKARVEAKKAADQARRAEVGEGQKPITKVDKHEEKAEKLRRQLAKVERKLENKRKREANDEGDEMRVDGTDSDSSDSEDEKPEVLTSRKQSSFLPPPPITRADPTNHCKYYSTGGICGKKSKCRFVHDKDMREQALLEQAANGGRMTLKQRLMRNDKETEDLAVVQSIVTLRASGKLVDAGQAAKTTTSVTPNTSLPARPDFLPPTPMSTHTVNRSQR